MMPVYLYSYECPKRWFPFQFITFRLYAMAILQKEVRMILGVAVFSVSISEACSAVTSGLADRVMSGCSVLHVRVPRFRDFCAKVAPKPFSDELGPVGCCHRLTMSRRWVAATLHL
jgi:hypothetical protein